MTIPPADEIRALAGSALTILAYELGLAPPEVWWDAAYAAEVCGPCYRDRFATLCPTTLPWEPHVDLTQADAVLRTLRVFGWSIFQAWDGRDACGVVEVTWCAPHGDAVPRAYACANHSGHDEAHALLLVACLARAAQVGEEGICA
jgi:hypothetical protein